MNYLQWKIYYKKMLIEKQKGVFIYTNFFQKVDFWSST